MVNFTISNDSTDKEITVKYGKNCTEAQIIFQQNGKKMFFKIDELDLIALSTHLKNVAEYIEKEKFDNSLGDDNTKEVE
jgi:hypothetical protein